MIVCHAGMALSGKSSPIRQRPSPTETVPATVGFFIDIMRVGGIGLINNVTVAFSVVVVTAILGHFGAAALADMVWEVD